MSNVLSLLPFHVHVAPSVPECFVVIDQTLFFMHLLLVFCTFIHNKKKLIKISQFTGNNWECFDFYLTWPRLRGSLLSCCIHCTFAICEITKSNFAGIMFVRFSAKNSYFIAILQKTWSPWAILVSDGHKFTKSSLKLHVQTIVNWIVATMFVRSYMEITHFILIQQITYIFYDCHLQLHVHSSYPSSGEPLVYQLVI